MPCGLRVGEVVSEVTKMLLRMLVWCVHEVPEWMDPSLSSYVQRGIDIFFLVRCSDDFTNFLG